MRLLAALLFVLLIAAPALAQDTTKPVITNVQAVASGTSVTVSWTLNEFATGQVEYGPTTAYGTLNTPELSFNYSAHVQTITGLTNNTLYHYRVRSQDAAGNLAISGDFTVQIGVPTVTGKITSTVLIEGMTATATVSFPLTPVGATSVTRTILVNSISGGQRIGSIVLTGPFRIVTSHCQTNPDGPDWPGVFAPNSFCDLIIVFEPITAVAGVGTMTAYPMPAPATTYAVDDRVVVIEPTGAWVRTTGSPNGTVIGTQATGSFGTITGPPVTVDNGVIWWWPVKYVGGFSGYTRHADLAPVPVCRWTMTYTPPGAPPTITDKDSPTGQYDLTVDKIEGATITRLGALSIACP